MNTNRFFGLNGLVTLAVVLVFLGLVSNAMAYETQRDRRNMVAVEVTPIQLALEQTARFRVSMNTHSVNLGQDMAAASSLTDDQGNVYKVAKWNGSAPGGHHRAGELEFPAIRGDAKSVTLVIKGIGGVPERSFNWDIAK